MKKTLKEKDGAAIIIAIIIMAVFMMLSLAMMLVSFSLFATSNRQKDLEQCKELSESLSVELQAEIEESNYQTYDEMKEALGEDESSEPPESPLWFYLRYNIGQTNWNSYEEDSSERGHTARHAFRYFDVTNLEDIEAVDDISVLIYWIDAADDVNSNAEIIIQITTKKGNQKSTVTSTYDLSIEREDEGFENAPIEDSGRPSINPSGNIINATEKWEIFFSKRE